MERHSQKKDRCPAPCGRDHWGSYFSMSFQFSNSGLGPQNVKLRGDSCFYKSESMCCSYWGIKQLNLCRKAYIYMYHYTRNVLLLFYKHLSVSHRSAPCMLSHFFILSCFPCILSTRFQQDEGLQFWNWSKGWQLEWLVDSLYASDIAVLLSAFIQDREWKAGSWHFCRQWIR